MAFASGVLDKSLDRLSLFNVNKDHEFVEDLRRSDRDADVYCGDSLPILESGGFLKPLKPKLKYSYLLSLELRG